MALPGSSIYPSGGIWPGLEEAPTSATLLFTPPGVVAVPSGQDRLWFRFKSYQSKSVLKNGSFYTEVSIPDTEDIEAADVVYLGGHSYYVTALEADSLTAAGFGAGLSAP